ncbi:MAG TPA: GNAT family N-acetyltransferase [Acidimicrobiales bacterium]|nr:GNAT family N-acetyltransferase [Acidimicrobiales bacterium]
MTNLTSLPSRTEGFERRIRPATADDLPTLAYVLGSALHDDPVWSWTAPDPRRRRAHLGPLTELLAASVQRGGGNHLNESGTGAAVWAPPGAGLPRHDDGRFAAALAAATGADAGRTARLLELLDANHPTGVPHYYLMLHGVIPERQGHGIGSSLLRATLERADRERQPAYLQATSRRSRRLYERHGFVTIGELTTPGCPPIHAMWRAPRT